MRERFFIDASGRLAASWANLLNDFDLLERFELLLRSKDEAAK